MAQSSEVISLVAQLRGGDFNMIDTALELVRCWIVGEGFDVVEPDAEVFLGLTSE